ncbi:MAG: aerobic-type carbon monoxide dehydrogenase, large subunit CoxL/CutL-like protein [Pedosphaera sp.]|nr:aerobic-type carbon monoxide dehydrogenase, large subunit CoxL/CutL-like protein [Pedosphaera sp.]
MPTVATDYIGQPISRVDGLAKVTGVAKYAGEFNVPGLAYGYAISSTIAMGRIHKIDSSEALKLEGVFHVFTHENSPTLALSDDAYRDDVAPTGSPFRPLHDDRVVYSGQPIGLVVAASLELARYAATLVRVEYQVEPHATDPLKNLGEAYVPEEGKTEYKKPKPRGRAQEAFAAAASTVAAEYIVPMEHHNPMEPYASTVVWNGDEVITVYDKTQGVDNVQRYLYKIFGCPPEQVRVISPFVGGGFGSGLRPQYEVFLAFMAARELKRPVRVTLTRQQMFSLGYRPATWQRVSLGATKEGRLEAIIHEAIGETSRYESYAENVLPWSGLLYQCANVQFDYKLVPLDLCTPIDMRAPGAATGFYALECAMDELAVKLGMDPLELRLRNYAEQDQNEGKPFSSKELRACYQQGAERFGWARRNPTPRSMREGKKLIGWGMASAAWVAFQTKAAAKAALTQEGKLTVSSATADIGTGTYTIMTQIAASTLGLPIEDVTFNLGDTALPEAEVEGGSFTAASVGSAVKNVCEVVREKVFRLAQAVPNSPLAGASLADVTFAEGKVRLKRDATKAVAITAAMRQGGVNAIEEERSIEPDEAKRKGYSFYTHAATFAEVKVDEDFGTVRVSRVVSAVAGGRILNPKTARSQVLGAVVMGIGMALEEESVVDHNLGRIVNHNFAEYHVPVEADVRDIQVIFVEERDEIINPLGAKGLGEIGIVGVAAAIANAVYHATGKRVRELPITLDKVM